MSNEISEVVGKPNGVEQVCRILDFLRSTLYE